MPAAGETDTGVIVAFNSEDKDITSSLIIGENEKTYAINPLNWKTDNTPGTADENIKAVFYMPEHKNIFWRKVEVKNFCGAVIDPQKGVLKIDCPAALLHTVNGKYTKNCISIFAGNIAANAQLRTDNLIKARQWSEK